MVRNMNEQISVKDILEECKRLLTFAKDFEERIDIYEASKGLHLTMQELENCFEKSYDEVKVAGLKKECSQAAIQLEYLLARYSQRYEVRYRDRSEVASLYAELRNALARSCKNPKVDLRELLLNLSKVAELASRTGDVIFILGDKDRKNIEQIKMFLISSACMQEER